MTSVYPSSAREMPLTKGKVALVDTEDYGWLIRFKWTAHIRGYASCHLPKSEGGASFLMHRVIMDAPRGLEVDHINGNKLDNRRCNLRIVTKAQNQHNRHAILCAAGYKGVKCLGVRFQARIGCRDAHRHLGTFDTAEDAARAYNAAALEMWGEYAHLNTIP